jgi:thiol-disulfide isomerase/thioredoxin
MANADGTAIQSKDSLLTIYYKDENNTDQSLDISKNKLTALHFWASWCIPCAKELPMVNAAQKKYADRGLKIIPLSMDFNVDQIKRFYKENNIDTLAVMLDYDQKTLKNFKVKGLPTTIFISSEGAVIARTEGEISWESKAVEDFIINRTGF